jgi:hypothetical protein
VNEFRRRMRMRAYICTAVFCLYLTAPAFCSAADVMPIVPDCKMLQSSAATKREQRIEIVAPGFSILPPQGERWCYRFLTSFGVSFFKIPPSASPLDRPPSLEEVVATRMFSAIAVSLKGLLGEGVQIQNADDLKTFVDGLIRENLFSQVLTGLSSGEHRFRLLESKVEIRSFSSALCVRFDTRIEERGNVQAPALLFVLNFPGNVVCRHPAVAETELIWIGFVERYLQGEQPISDTLKGEYEPYVQSLQFTTPR